MISAGDFKNGVTFEVDGQVMQILEFQHVKPGKGAAFVRTKVKNLMTGSVVEKTFNPNEKFAPAFVERKIMQYLYEDSGLVYFMDSETYEQMPIDKKVIGESLKFVKENTDVKVIIYKGNAFDIEVPNFVELKVLETEPSIKGNTATNVTKNAVVETGADVKVPMFVNVDEVIKIDTRTGTYIERV